MEIAELLKTIQKNIHLRIAGNKKEGVITNLSDFDSILNGGLHRGSLNVIAGRYSMGKTSFSVTTACNIAEIHNLPICFFKLDDCKENLTRSFITHKTGFNNGELNNKEFNHKEKSVLDKSIKDLGKLPLNIFDNPLVSISEIYQICIDIKKETKDKKLGLVVIEDLQSLEYYKLNNSEEETKNHIAKKLKSLAEELDVPIIITSQIIKDVELRNNKRPEMRDLKNFTEIIQYADTIITLYRNDYYDSYSEVNGIAEIIIRKNRNGPIGTLYLSFEPDYKKFKTLNEDNIHKLRELGLIY